MVEIVIRKARRCLELVDGGTLRSFPIALGFAPIGHKRREGDGKTPEGEYFVCTRNAQSLYHLALGLSYPNLRDAEDAMCGDLITDVQYGQIAQAAQAGRRPPWDTPLGGFLMIHGGGAASDWTQGCIAMSDKDIERLWDACPLGTKVTILP